MNRAIVVQPEARGDLDDIFDYIAPDSVAAARRVVAAARQTFDRIARMPGLGRQRDFDNPELSALRSIAIRGFRNYIVFYIPSDTAITVVRVLHGARDLDSIFAPPDDGGAAD